MKVFFSKKKSFDKKISDIDKLWLIFLDYNGRIDGINDDISISNSVVSDYINKSVRCLFKIAELLTIIIKEHFVDITQEQVDILINKYILVTNNTNGYKLRDYTYLKKYRDELNVFLNILYHLKMSKGFNTYGISDNRFNNPLCLFKEDRFVYLMHTSAYERRKKEKIEKYKDIDPYGEEVW